MDNVVIVKATQHMDNGVALTYVSQELVTESFALAGTLYQSCYIHNFYCSGLYTLRVNERFELFKACIGDIDHP